jgi:hypothetical protein
MKLRKFLQKLTDLPAFQEGCYVYIENLFINPLNAKLNPICHLLALLGTHHILHVSGVRVNVHL